MSEITKDLVGVSGTHFVAAQLTREGYVALVTSRNTKGIDIIVSKADSSKLACIQVKTKSQKGNWPVSKSIEKNYGKNLFYVFVDLSKGNKQLPDIYVFKSEFVAKYVERNHKKYEKTHKKTDRRIFPYLKDYEKVDFEKARSKWKLLGLD